MDKTRKPTEEHEEEIMKKNIQKRFENMFTGSGEPLTNLSIHEVENLQSRVAELEAQLAQQPLQSNQRLLPTLAEAARKVEPSRERPVHRKKPATTETEPKQVALWIAGIFIAVSLGFVGYSLYNLFSTQGGQADLSDKALIPFTLVMVIMSVIGFRLICCAAHPAHRTAYPPSRWELLLRKWFLATRDSAASWGPSMYLSQGLASYSLRHVPPNLCLLRFYARCRA